MTHCVIVVTIFRRDIVLPSSGNTPTVWTSIIAVTLFLVFDPFNGSHSRAAGLAVSSQQLAGGGTRPAGSKPTHYVQCVCLVTPSTTPIFAMTRLQKYKEINSVRFSSWNFLIRWKVFIDVPFLKICTTDRIENTQRYFAVHSTLSPVFAVDTRLLKI